MSYEQVWIAIFIPALLAAAALAVWARHLREAKRVAEREMIHRERMAALEKGAALPELPAGLRGASEETGNGRAWVSQAALLAGLTLLLGGIGLFVAFIMVPDTPEMGGLQAMAPIGLIPAFAGLGLLLFYDLDRRARRHTEE
jgi:hypothetical protein